MQATEMGLTSYSEITHISLHVLSEDDAVCVQANGSHMKFMSITFSCEFYMRPICLCTQLRELCSVYLFLL
jgi:hypothetical protein